MKAKELSHFDFCSKTRRRYLFFVMNITFCEPENTLIIRIFLIALKDNTSLKITQQLYPKYQLSVSLSHPINNITADYTDAMIH